MKHPRLEVLQDYFENALTSHQENLVKAHLLECDQCTKMLSDFTIIENKVLGQKPVTISDQTRRRIFSDARLLLDARKQKEALLDERKQKLETLISEWRELIYPQLKIPALQFSSLSVVLMVVVALERGPGEEYVDPLLSDEVGVLTYKGFDKKVEDL